MESCSEERRFPSTSKIYASVLFRLKGTIRGKDVTIFIAPAENNNYIYAEFANKLMIPESNISERLDLWEKTNMK